MPCRVDDWEPKVSQSSYDEERKKAQKYKRDLDKVTRLLCSVMREYDLGELDPELATWWDKHQEVDRKRQERERKVQEKKEREAREAKRQKELRKQALGKLSLEERLALKL